ncbi:unnamed protein product [Leptosia nina]|uniref:Uncharacterized protein n=1 Tax=Leptosia nina TaxID=320188 RepID=A0AAV1IW01_9NEOP
MAALTSTPVNTVSREHLTVLIRNNIMNESTEFVSDSDKMENDSPMRKVVNLKPITKKLFHSPMESSSPQKATFSSQAERIRQLKRKSRRRSLLPGEEDKIKRAYVAECDRDRFSPNHCEGMRKRVLISWFHNKEYTMEFCD